MTTEDNIAEWDAAYVLGALSADERREYENYLAANPARSADVTELAWMPAILDMLTRDEALALIDRGPTTHVSSLAARRQRRSRRTVVASALATAAALLIAGGVVGATVFPRSAPVETVALQPMQATPNGGVTAALAVSQKGWGTRLDWTCEYTKDWAKDVASYDMVVTTTDGAQTVVGSWSPAGDEAAGLAASTTIPTDQIRSVDIRISGTQEPLTVTTL